MIPANIHTYMRLQMTNEAYDIIAKAIAIAPTTVSAIIAKAGLTARSKPEQWKTLPVSLFAMGRSAYGMSEALPDFFTAWGEDNYPNMREDEWVYDTPAFGGDGSPNEFNGVRVVSP